MHWMKWNTFMHIRHVGRRQRVILRSLIRWQTKIVRKACAGMCICMHGLWHLLRKLIHAMHFAFKREAAHDEQTWSCAWWTWHLCQLSADSNARAAPDSFSCRSRTNLSTADPHREHTSLPVHHPTFFNSLVIFMTVFVEYIFFQESK